VPVDVVVDLHVRGTVVVAAVISGSNEMHHNAIPASIPVFDDILA